MQVPMLTLSGHTEAVSCMDWMDDTSLITGSWDHTLRVWDMKEAKQSALLVIFFILKINSDSYGLKCSAF